MISDQDWWWNDGAVVGAIVERGSIVHGGRINLAADFAGGAYSMSPLCAAYRKANGKRPARLDEYGTPQLVRNLRVPFADYRNGLRTGRTVCRWCSVMWDRIGGAAADAILATTPIDSLETS
jgi:hypothetical protein